MMYTFNQYYLTMRLARKATHDIHLSYAMHKPGYKVLLKIYNAKCRHLYMTPEGFQYHARKFKHLSHPHIAPILDIGIEKGKPYVVHDYFLAGSLRQQMERVAPKHFLLDTVLALILDVGSALSYAHSQSIVHQKVKPENIFLNAQGQVLLADFSLHELINENVFESKPDDRVINYMAPEQLTGSATASSDQYALACLFYELITGKLPFTARDLSYLGQHHTIPSPTPPSQFVATLPKRMESAVLKALSQKPEERYPDVAAFLEALGEAVPSVPPAFPFKQLMPRPGLRHPKETPPPVPTVRLASAQATRKEPKIEPLSLSFGVKKSGQSPEQGDIDVPSPYRIDRISPLSLSEEFTASLWDEYIDGTARQATYRDQLATFSDLFEVDDALLFSVPPSEWLDDSTAPAVPSKSNEEEVEPSQLSYEGKEAELIDQEEEAETVPLAFGEEEIELPRRPFVKGERTERSPWDDKDEEIELSQSPLMEEEIDLTQLSFSKRERASRSRWRSKEEKAKRSGLVIKEEQDEHSQVRGKEKKGELSQWTEKGEQAVHSQLDNKRGKEVLARLSGKEEKSKHPQLNSLEVAVSSLVPAYPVSPTQLQGLPVAQRSPLSKSTYALLSAASICIVVIAFLLISNKSIIHLMNDHTSVQAVSVAARQPTPTVVTITPAKKELQLTPSRHPEVLILMVLYLGCQFLYLFAFATMRYYFLLSINRVNTARATKIGEGHQTSIEEENRKLKREIEILQQERETLKKALSIFAQSHP